ncbi:MAG: hypothetical protein JST00_39745 [Deltaproteobacteria bacterium]|nr:hypothetical protein [Deltaproteobacteria bacterium]
MAFTVASLGASAMNYLFQVHAAAVLDAREFGLLSAWLAIVTAFGAVVTFVQFLSLEARLDDARWPSVARLAGFGALVVLALHLVSGARASPAALGVTSVIGGIAAAALVGQLQARLALGIIGVAMLATTAVRFGLPFGWPRDARASGFYLGHAASPYAGMVVVGIFALGRSRGGAAAARESSAEPRERVRLARPMILGLATAVFPYVDVLAVSATQDAATTGELSRIVLVSRAIFYGGLAAFGVLFPHQLHAATRGEPMPPFAVLLERLLPLAVVAGAVPAAWVLDRAVLHTHGELTTWLYASSLGGATTVAVLGEANRLAARGRLRAAAASVGGVLLASAAAAATSLGGSTSEEQVTRYTAVAFACNAVVLVAARAARGGERGLR